MRNAILVLLLLLSPIFVKAQTVYKTPSGKKYHTSNCHTVKNTSEALSVEDASAIGLTPCKICKPSQIQGVVKKASTSGEKPGTMQCLGTTKKGKRCKHMTSIGNGYCFQHQPD
ncbi:DUF5763 domain-containing protein [Flavobacterium sp.]|uniref:DUF5763 domain-containing protein n=1 Tax=Flavobacterium sp. TaxID=239 RepID=UPI003459EB30